MDMIDQGGWNEGTFNWNWTQKETDEVKLGIKLTKDDMWNTKNMGQKKSVRETDKKKILNNQQKNKGKPRLELNVRPR